MSEEKTQKKECRYCFQQIHVLAHICHYCGRYQKRAWQYFRLERLILFASIVAAIFACFEFNAAKDALDQASSAYQATKETATALVRITYLQFQTRNELGDSPRLKKSRELVENDLIKIIHLMFPDPDEQKAFTQKLESELPPKEPVSKP